jgi:hypothetical protein
MQDVSDRETTNETGPDEGYGIVSKAVIGVAAGAVGTWALDRTDWRMWKQEDEEARLQTNAVRPFGEPPAHVLVSKAEKVLGLKPTPEQHEIAGDAVHYGIGIVPAVAYAVVRHKLPGGGPARGALFGLGLFLVQDELVNAATGVGAKPREYPWQAHARGLVSHLVYGVVTEVVLNMMDRSVRARRIGAETGGEAQGQPRAIRT